MSLPEQVRTLTWPYGQAEVQRLGGMLGPVRFKAAGRPDFSPLQVAPWADEPGADALPALLRRLRGEWPCVPFGRTDRPAGLPDAWQAREPDDACGHGHGAHHDWDWLPADDPLSLRLAIDYPPASPVRRLLRSVRAVPDAPALELTLQVEVRRPCRLPIALHPTVRLDLGRVALRVDHSGPGRCYPVPAEPGVSRLAPDAVFERLQAVPLADGGTLDLSRYPLPFDTEELLQLQAIGAPVRVDYLDQGWSLELDWDRTQLPDLMLWVSHRGRRYPPWNLRHWALGVEPLNGPFDLGQVALPPAGHRRGVELEPGVPWMLSARLQARLHARHNDHGHHDP